jgi:hypothetical protein
MSMRRYILHLTPLLIALASLPARAAKAQVYTCPSQPTQAAQLRAIAVDIATDARDQDVRDSLGITAVDTAQIAVITTDSICNAVTNGVARAATAPPASGLIVVKWGTAYAACVASGLMRDIYILDDSFKLRFIYTVPS